MSQRRDPKMLRKNAGLQNNNNEALPVKVPSVPGLNDPRCNAIALPMPPRVSPSIDEY
jgi:hypothetical protein